MNKYSDKVFVNQFIKTCHQIALAYLRIKAAGSRIYYIQNEKLEDLAWDYIAEIFECDDDGNFIKVVEYFGCGAINLNDPETVIKLRKLIFTKVDDSLFREAGAKDPSLKKIIRNIKLSIRERNCLLGVCIRNGKLIIEEEFSSLPQMPPEILQAYLTERIGRYSQIPDILGELIDIFNQQNKYNKTYSLVGVALVIRHAYVELMSQSFTTKTSVDTVYYELIVDEIHNNIKRSSQEVKEKLGKKYLKRGRLSEKLLDAYSNASEQFLKEQFTGTNGEISQFECLSAQIEDLCYEKFRKHHRSVLEYIVKSTREKFISIYRKEIA